ncbi:1-phosphatidylinositol 4,5-bisphosphate phosphodiesterase eta-2a [Poecilia latipinna]|uniref:1-phosphatidylinositol 4,5-bisphosphate phosphodiesterase eta-2a n=1 Tax=Poecilia latipinna TaxID=48699 RepID=UPI00072EE623|nr:PREDICTED: 1-phosphatidylinositol 4,5-bisphosphate phosphodiesterase eta-2-like [Poecilia latipinna]
MSTAKRSGFSPFGSVPSALMRSAAAATGDKPARGAFSLEKEKQKDGTACEKQEQASVGRVLEEFFWIGTSIVAFSKWRLGYMVEKCMSSMQIGTQMVKLRGGSKGLVRFFYLDEHKSCIRWRPSRKNEKAKISIDSIREVCEGKQSEIFQRYADGSFDPNCCFSLYYGEHMESLDLVSGTGEEARTWITGLKYLMAGISDEDSLAKRQRTRDQWLKQTFTEADKNGDGSLSINEVLQLLHKLNVNLPRQKVKQMFKEADTDDKQGTLGFEEFCSFYKMMSTRRDLYLLMLTYSNHKDHLDTDDITRFLETEQKMTKVTKDHCLEIINKFEPCSENQKQGVLGIDGFTNYMRSPAGDIFNPEHYNVNQDMTQPLCNYFIASSHNTYLMGDQLMSQSRVDMYAWVLQAGCRCVEVDCWDGQDGEPIVHHGYTLTSKILFKDVIETINKYAFIKTDYPVILSIENHCSVPQQKKMAQYLVEILGDKLDVSSVKAEESGRLPSPESLRGKILVKTSANRKQVENMAKKKLDNLMKESKIRDREDPDSFTIAGLPPSGKTLDKSDIKGKSDEGTDTADETNPSSTKRSSRSFIGSFSKRKKKSSKLKKTSSYEDTDTDQESTSSASRAPPHHNKKKKTMKLSRALSDLVKYTCSVGLYDIEAQANCSWQVSSLSETKAHQLMQQKAGSFIQFNQRQLSRIYPSSYRVDSSNFNPQPFWSSGCQLVALNYQSEGRVLQLNRAKFYSNGNCGYILKPACMCEGAFNPNLEDPLPGRMKKQLVLKIISGQQLPKPKDSMLGDRGEIIDPFVEVEIIGLPVDCCKEQTRVVDDNGFNPMWEETLVFTVHMPELALVRFLVWDHDPIGQDFIGQRTIAFHSMMPGYRHVYLEGMEEASIFVHVAVNDITGKARAAGGIKGLFHRNPKQASLDSHAVVHPGRKHPFGAHLLRRTASAPTRGQPKVKKGFPELAIDTKDYSSEGASEERESEDRDRASAATSYQFTPSPQHHIGESVDPRQAKGSWDRPDTNGALHPEESKGKSSPFAQRRPMSEPLKRASHLRFHEPLDMKPGVFARVALSSSGRMGMSSNCITCVIGSKESPEAERKVEETQKGKSGKTDVDRQERNVRSDPDKRQARQDAVAKTAAAPPDLQQPLSKATSCMEAQFQWPPQAVLCTAPFSRSKARQTLGPQHFRPHPQAHPRSIRSCSVPRRRSPNAVTPAPCMAPDCRTSLCWQQTTPPNYGSVCGSSTTPLKPLTVSEALLLSDSSSCDSLSSLESPPMLPPRSVLDSRKRAVGTLQREMNALFTQKMEELHHKSPMFFAGKMNLRPTWCLSIPIMTNSSTVQESNSPPRIPSLKGGNPSSSCLIRSASSPEQSLSPHRSTPTPLHPPSALPSASTAGSPLYGAAHSTTKVSRDVKASTSFPPNNPAEMAEPSLSPRVAQATRGALEEKIPERRKTPETLAPGERRPQRAEPPGETRPPGSLGPPAAQPPQARRALFSSPPQPVPVRRAKSEGHVLGEGAKPAQSAVPEICTDATMNDRLWSKLEPGSHRDSMSSSSSISSNDTVIDLSLPNLARRSLCVLPSPSNGCDASWMDCRHAAPPPCDTVRVSKSKSNPNLQQRSCPKDELKPRPLQPAQNAADESPGRLTQRRHTWCRLYMEGLKQASPKRPSGAATSAPSMSKSLGDLTSEDISCNFDSKYRSISRSFIVRPSRDVLRKGSAPRSRPQSDLTEQLRRLTDVEPLSPCDFIPEGGARGTGGQEAEEALVRRTSSRSQSRVRYIANRAKQAQERKRLQGLLQARSASFSFTGSTGSGIAGPMEERGNPEGACSVGQSPCSSLDLLSQLEPPSHVQPPVTADSTQLFFRLQL